MAAQTLRDTGLRAIHARLRPVHRGRTPEVARHAEPVLPRGIPAHRVSARLSLLARRAMLMDIVVEFLVMFISAGAGFIIGVVFMGMATAGAMALLDNQIDRLEKEVSLAT